MKTEVGGRVGANSQSAQGREDPVKSIESSLKAPVLVCSAAVQAGWSFAGSSLHLFHKVTWFVGEGGQASLGSYFSQSGMRVGSPLHNSGSGRNAVGKGGPG